MYILIWGAATVFLLIKGGLTGYALSGFFNVDLVVLFTAYLFISRGETGAGVFAFCQGALTDIFSGGFAGLFVLLYLIVFLGIRIGSRPLDLLSSGGQFALVSLSVMLKYLLIIVAHDLFSINRMFMFTDFLAMLSSSLISGLFAPFLFSLLNYLDCFLVERYEKS